MCLHACWLGTLGGNVRVRVFFVGYGVVKGGNVGWLVEAPPFVHSLGFATIKHSLVNSHCPKGGQLLVGKR